MRATLGMYDDVTHFMKIKDKKYFLKERKGVDFAVKTENLEEQNRKRDFMKYKGRRFVALM